MNRTIDPIALGVVWDRLIAIADSILLSIVRSAFSVGVREAWDVACVVFDREGRSIAQAGLSMPAFIGTAPYTIEHLLARFPPATLAEGDVLATNDPWMGTGHTPDLCVVRPVFYRGSLVGFVMTISHLPDIGGRGLTIDNCEIYEEGLILPPCRLYREGQPNDEVLDILRANVRVVDEVIGDIEANVAGGAVGEQLIGECLDEFGLEDLQAVADGIVRQSEAAMRAELKSVPDGTYTNRLEVEAPDGPVILACAVTIAGDTATIDYTGTGAAVGKAINVPLCYTRSFTGYAIKTLTTPAIPNNQGMLAPLRITAPQGCILNASRPSATGGRHTVGWFIVPLVYGALAEALPDRVQADSGMVSLFIVAGARADGREIATQYFLAGGLGAMHGLDGHHTTPSPTNNAVVSSEVWEAETGVRVAHRRLLPDSGGAGRWRGGLGQEAVLSNDSDNPVTVSLFGMRSEFAARGLFGGRSGALREFLLDGQPIPAKGRVTLGPGQTLTVREAGGGGYGDPRRRDSAARAADLEAGFVTAEGLLRDYGDEPPEGA
ncbi:MAG: hydantoinase B/oxoprolinase family protein [Rhodospirillaceae bacterium]|nr:hydantoinase B/oxoprolinase family protein [Rhodospirillaceae bacterium]